MDHLKKALSAKPMAISGWSGQQDPLYLAMLARSALDIVTLDMQHGMQTEESVIRGIASIAPTGKPVVVRIPVGRFDLASKFLDAGALGIIAPMINTVEDAKALVSFAKYLPTGDRSFGPTQAAAVLGATPVDYVKSANDNTVIMAMIETRQAVENMEAIADVDGVDALFVGPGDLSISVRNNVVPDAYGPDTIDIVESIAKAAAKRGKFAASWCGSVEHVELVNKLGFDFAALGHDHMYLNTGIDTMLNQMSFR